MIVLCRCMTCKSLSQEEYLQLHGYVTWTHVCVCFCLSTFFLLDYFISVSDDKQRLLEDTTTPAVSSGAEVRRRAHSRLLPCKVHATPQGTGYVPQALQNRCSEGTQFFFITYIFTKSVAASFGKGSQTLRDESLRCARSSAWGRPRRCNPEVKDLHHHHHHRHH